MKIFCDIVGSLILSISAIYVISKIMKFSIKTVGTSRYIVAVIILALYLVSSYYSTMMFLRYMLSILALPLIVSLVLKQPFKESFITGFITFILIVISEFIFALIIVGIFKIDLNNFYGMISSNIGVAAIMAIIISIPKVYKFVQMLLNKLSISKKYFVIILSIAFCLSVSIIVYINYFDISSQIRFILSLIIIIVYTAITIILFNEKNINNKMQCEYEMVLKNLNDYEKMLDYQKVANHENKNQLLVIKGMIDKKEPNVNEYISSIISEQLEDNEDILYKTNIIPSGGLRGIIYYKILSMKEQKINVSLKIDSNLRKISLEKLGTNLNKDLCKIMGVILDNAIQAVEKLKAKNIDIEMNYMANQLVIMVSNNFEGDINLSEIDNIGYTTKGDGHGYGLTLMKNIIEKNQLLNNQKYIYGQKFIQKITVKINN